MADNIMNDPTTGTPYREVYILVQFLTGGLGDPPALGFATQAQLREFQAAVAVVKHL